MFSTICFFVQPFCYFLSFVAKTWALENGEKRKKEKLFSFSQCNETGRTRWPSLYRQANSTVTARGSRHCMQWQPSSSRQWQLLFFGQFCQIHWDWDCGLWSRVTNYLNAQRVKLFQVEHGPLVGQNWHNDQCNSESVWVAAAAGSDAVLCLSLRDSRGKLSSAGYTVLVCWLLSAPSQPAYQ